MKILLSLVIVIIFLSYNPLPISGNDSCGSYERYVFKFIHVYHAYFEANTDDLIKEYKTNYDSDKIFLDKDILLGEISSTIIDSANRNDIKLSLVTMTKSTLYSDREILRLGKSLRKAFGFEKDDNDFMDEEFIFGAKGLKYKGIQEDLLNYVSAIDRFISTRKIGDVFILSIKDGKGMLEYRPFNEEQKIKLMENAEKRIVKMYESIHEIEKQFESLPMELEREISKVNQQELTQEKADNAKKSLKKRFSGNEKIMKYLREMIKKKIKEVKKSKEALVESDDYQTIKPEKILFDNPEIILRSISTYIQKERCLINKMPEEMLCLLIGTLALHSIVAQ